jgi:hypothetical protein
MVRRLQEFDSPTWLSKKERDMKKLIVLALIGLAFFAGCGDDDEPVDPSYIDLTEED